MIFLLVDLKIVLASILLIKIEGDLKGALNWGRGTNSNRGAYPNLKSYGGTNPRKYGILCFSSLYVLSYMKNC